MGREAACVCRSAEGAVEVRALLEAHELILRGGLKRRFPIGELARVRTLGDELCFEIAGEAYALALGAASARRWAEKIARPPPSLRDKLGVGPTAPALVIGALVDPGLQQALEGAEAATLDQARLSVAVIHDEAALMAALAVHAGLAADAPIWVVHGKGAAAFGESGVRTSMRALGFVDSKSCAVSQTLSATRYARRGGAAPDPARGAEPPDSQS